MDKYPVFEAPDGDKIIKTSPELELWDSPTKTVKSLIRSIATAIRCYTFPDKNITVAGLDDIKVLPVYIQTADQSFGNTTTETTLIGTGVGSLTITANSLQAGDVIKVKVKGYYSKLSGNLTVRNKLGSNTQASSAITTTISTNGVFEIEIIITIRTTGASGTAIMQGSINFYDSNGELSGNSKSLAPETAAFTIDTTAAITYDLTLQFSSANASNSVTTTNLIIDKTSA